MMVDPDGNLVSDEEVQEMIRETINRTGRFILDSEIMEPVGTVQFWAGLPFRIVRQVTIEEHRENFCPDIWGPPEQLDPNRFHFEVEVAD